MFYLELAYKIQTCDRHVNSLTALLIILIRALL